MKLSVQSPNRYGSLACAVKTAPALTKTRANKAADVPRLNIFTPSKTNKRALHHSPLIKAPARALNTCMIAQVLLMEDAINCTNSRIFRKSASRLAVDCPSRRSAIKLKGPLKPPPGELNGPAKVGAAVRLAFATQSASHRQAKTGDRQADRERLGHRRWRKHHGLRLACVRIARRVCLLQVVERVRAAVGKAGTRRSRLDGVDVRVECRARRGIEFGPARKRPPEPSN